LYIRYADKTSAVSTELWHDFQKIYGTLHQTKGFGLEIADAPPRNDLFRRDEIEFRSVTRNPLRCAAGYIVSPEADAWWAFNRDRHVSAGLGGRHAGEGPAARPAFYDWSGVYVGVHAGYGGGMKDWPGNNGIGFGADFVARGAFGGGQIGINKQLGSAVFGLELDGSWANISGFQNLVLGGPAPGVLANQATSSKIDGLVSFAGRAAPRRAEESRERFPSSSKSRNCRRTCS
jgi:hypothetical protein